MEQELNSEGICSTCNFWPECQAYKNNHKIGKAVLHCEEFDDSAASNKGGNLAKSLSSKGLCENCDDAEICKLPGFGDYVVFCEEHSSNYDDERQNRSSHKIIADRPGLGIKNLIPGWDS